LDVKTGTGAFMQTLPEARQLAELMVSIGKLSGRNVVALLSDMNQPLGIEVGNALEMKEAILTLKGQGPVDFTEHCLEVASQMLILGKKADTKESARRLAEEAIESGTGFEFLRKLIIAQGGDVSFIDNPEKLPAAPLRAVVEASVSGTVSEVNARNVGETAVILGAGRKKKGEKVDLAVGVSVLCKVGEKVEKGQPIFMVHAREEALQKEAETRLLKAVRIIDGDVKPLPHFYGLVE